MTRFFVVGPPKTGTTVLTRLLTQHPALRACLAESWALEPGNPASLASPAGDKWAMHGLTREDAERYATLFRTRPKVEAFREVLEDAWARMNGGTTPEVAGDSWPFYPFHLGALHAAFPDAKYVYTTRDPRATYWSGETFKGRRHGLLIASQLLGADRRVRPFFQASVDPTRALVVRYEQLVVDPRGEVERLWRFLGVDPAEGWLEYDRARDPWPERWAWVSNATAPLDATRIDRWQGEISAQERRVVSLAAAEYCATYGYPVELDESYRLEEMFTAFLCGGSLSHYPIDVEEQVRQELVRRMGAPAPRPAAAGGGDAARPTAA